MTSDDIPACACSAHPPEDDRKKYMLAVEEDAEKIVWCCRRCTEITHVAVIQVRTLPRGVARARYVTDEQRRRMDPQLLRMLMARKRGRVRYQREEETHA
jgi:hypothetical protein